MIIQALKYQNLTILSTCRRPTWDSFRTHICRLWMLPLHDMSQKNLKYSFSKGENGLKWHLAFRWLLCQFPSDFHEILSTWHPFINPITLFRLILRIVLHVNWSHFLNTHCKFGNCCWVFQSDLDQCRSDHSHCKSYHFFSGQDHFPSSPSWWLRWLHNVDLMASLVVKITFVVTKITIYGLT